MHFALTFALTFFLSAPWPQAEIVQKPVVQIGIEQTDAAGITRWAGYNRDGSFSSGSFSDGHVADGYMIGPEKSRVEIFELAAKIYTQNAKSGAIGQKATLEPPSRTDLGPSQVRLSISLSGIEYRYFERQASGRFEDEGLRKLDEFLQTLLPK